MRRHVIIAAGILTVWPTAPAVAQVVSGGKGQSRNSPGSAQYIKLTFGPGGLTNWTWQIDDAGPSPTYPNARGVAGGTADYTPGAPDYGWSNITLWAPPGPGGGTFTWTATPSNRFTLVIQTLTAMTTFGNDILGPMEYFDPNLNYSWQMVTWNGSVSPAYKGPTDVATLNASTVFDLNSGPFANAHPGQFGWRLNQYSSTQGELDLVYTVAEPGTFALVAAGLVAVWRFRQAGSRHRPVERTPSTTGPCPRGADATPLAGT